MSYSVSASAGKSAGRIAVHELRRGIEIKPGTIFDLQMTPAEARELARSLYVLATRLEKRLVKIQNAAGAKTTPLPESGDEARQESQAAPYAEDRANGQHLREAIG